MEGNTTHCAGHRGDVDGHPRFSAYEQADPLGGRLDESAQDERTSTANTRLKDIEALCALLARVNRRLASEDQDRRERLRVVK
jgi:hypothetical protein